MNGDGVAARSACVHGEGRGQDRARGIKYGTDDDYCFTCSPAADQVCVKGNAHHDDRVERTGSTTVAERGSVLAGWRSVGRSVGHTRAMSSHARARAKTGPSAAV